MHFRKSKTIEDELDEPNSKTISKKLAKQMVYEGRGEFFYNCGIKYLSVLGGRIKYLLEKGEKFYRNVLDVINSPN